MRKIFLIFCGVIAVTFGFGSLFPAFAEELLLDNSALNLILDIIPIEFTAVVTSIISICAVVATFLPPATESSSFAYSSFYKIIQFIALNFGKATNKQDVK